MKSELTKVLELSWPIVVIVLTILLILKIAYYRNNTRKFELSKEIMLFLFVTYILVLFQLVTYKNNEYSGINLMPFYEILRYDFGTKEFITQVLGNVLLFIPFGFFTCYFVNIKKVSSMLLMTGIVSVVIETVQYNIGRSFDVDDIILNIVGGLLGFFIYVCFDAIKKRLPSFFQKDFIYSILSILLIAFIVLYLMGIIRF